MNDSLIAKLAAAASVAGGFAILYVPPTLLGVGAGTVAFATSLIVGGFAALGVAIGIPAARASARREVQGPDPVTRARRKG